MGSCLFELTVLLFFHAFFEQFFSQFCWHENVVQQ
jgi:hypothetical protein